MMKYHPLFNVQTSTLPHPLTYSIAHTDGLDKLALHLSQKTFYSRLATLLICPQHLFRPILLLLLCARINSFLGVWFRI